MSKRTNVNITAKAADQLRSIQDSLERRLGFAPSLAQIVELLIKEHANTIIEDKVTDSQHVVTE